MAEIATFVAVFSLGLTASFSPCIFPILPTFIAFLTQSENKWWKSVIAGVLVTAGIITVFIFLGLIFSQIIGFLSIYYIVFRQIQGIFLIILGAFLVRSITFNFTFLNWLNNRAYQVMKPQDLNHWLSAYFLGLFFAFLAAPCAAVAFITLFIILITESAMASMSLMLVFSIGAGIPFVMMGILIPAFKGSFSDDFRQFQQFIPKIAGVVVILIGVFLILEANAII